MITLPGVINVRDIGGIKVSTGHVRKGLLFRGGVLDSASDEAVSIMSGQYHITKIFDFRTSMERNLAPDREIPGAQNIWMPAFDETSQTFLTRSLPHEAYRNPGTWLSSRSRDPFVQDVAKHLYLDMVDNEFTLIQYAGFLQNIIQTGGKAVYWHCSQGKDRTGLGAAFLLAALGADREAIMQDYCLSAECYAEELAKYTPLVDTEEERAVLRTFISVNPDYFADALDFLEDRYGSMEEVLSGPLCLMDEDIEKLRQFYVVD